MIVVPHTIYFLLADFPWLSPLANIRPNTKTVNATPIAIPSPPLTAVYFSLYSVFFFAS